jgi:guanylate kinase
MCEKGELFESTMYAGHCYGSRKKDVEEILAEGKHVLTVMDICGAMSLKTHFANVTTIYIKRDKRTLLKDLLNKQLSVDEKVSRLIALESEVKNAAICDYTVPVETYDQAAKEIIAGLFKKKTPSGKKA